LEAAEVRRISVATRITNRVPKSEQEPKEPTSVPPGALKAGSGNSASLQQQIRERAYELYVARGCQDGHADEDWRLAEEEILGITGGG
jgi:DUF2934 family protein